MNSSHVLIVDDDPALLTALRGALELRMPGIVLETCESATAAISKVSHSDSEYDAVVTDIKMPGMDGLALLREIRAIEPDLPMLLITGHGQHDLAVQALRGGAFDFIQKPIEREYFVASLTRAIRVRRLGRQLRLQREELANHAAELEQAVQERTQQLHDANRRKDEFLALLSHELRNPLAPIRSGLEILAMDDDGDRELIELMQEQLGHLVRLVDDLLDASRIMQGKIELRKEPIDLSALLKRSVKKTSELIAQHQQEFIAKLPDNPVWLHADPVRMAQVVENLLNNAAKYTDAGGRIELVVRQQNGQAVVSVRDTGVGIEQELLPSIFELFTQSSRSMNRAEGGLGIGLTLVQRLVEMHDGSISAHSEGPGKGSTFIVRLPVSQAAPKVVEPVEPVRPGNRRRILVVDDNVEAAKMLAMLLVERGEHEVRTAFNGSSALECINEFRPEIVLLDIGMPKMDGNQVARIVREIKEFRDIILVAVTGYGQESDRRRSERAGFDKHLVKPVRISDVEDLLLEFPIGFSRTQAET